jgi:dihydrofolate synthase/folylpolyglutamate synthase
LAIELDGQAMWPPAPPSASHSASSEEPRDLASLAGLLPERTTLSLRTRSGETVDSVELSGETPAWNGTLAALVVFAAADLDVWILEVGMGGRLDATNVIDPTGVLITNVSLDHCDWLGEDIETIAMEKAGIMRAGVPAVYGGSAVPQAIVAHAEQIGADLLLRDRDFTVEGVPQPGLPGEFQLGNAAAVLVLLNAAGLEAATDTGLVASVLPAVRLAARGQQVEEGGLEWLLDVAHNPAAACVLAESLAADSHDGATIAIIGALRDKDVEGMVEPLNAHVDMWIAVSADSHRAVPAGELARRVANACGRPCLIANSLDEAVHSARREASIGDRILATGSFYLVGPVLERLGLYSRPRS